MKQEIGVLVLASLLLLTGCSGESAMPVASSQVNNQTEVQDVSLVISPYVITSEPLASRADVPKKTGLNVYDRLDVALIPMQRLTGDKVYSIHQEQKQENFGKMTLKVPVGKYHLVAMANKAVSALDIASTESVEFPNRKATDLAYNYQDVTVIEGGTIINAELERSVAKFTLKSNDLRTPAVASVKLKMEGNCSSIFNPSTGYAADKQGCEATIVVSTTKVEDNSYSIYTFLATDDETVNISIELLDKDGQSLKKLQFDNVRLLRNKVTTYTGPLYSLSTEASFTFSGTDEIESSGQDKTFD